MSKLEKKSKKVLFLSAIRTDQASGGLTSTQRILNKSKSQADVKVFSLQPFLEQERYKFLYFIAAFPFPILVFLNRYLRYRFIEFFLRFSPFYFLSLFTIRIFKRPDVVIFNHHASFIYSLVFIGIRKIFVWHDLPSLKMFSRGNDKLIDKKITLCLEKCLLGMSNTNLGFSITDSIFMRRFHGSVLITIPAIDNDFCHRDESLLKDQFLLIANWNRPENSEGALQFFTTYSRLLNEYRHGVKDYNFHIAGSGAGNFYSKLLQLELNLPPIVVTERYEDIRSFNELALIAPIGSGAGIKLKTLEAWSVGIPVIGTKQAFSGMPRTIWKHAGICLNSLDELAELFFGQVDMLTSIEALRPELSYTEYQKMVKGNFDRISDWL